MTKLVAVLLAVPCLAIATPVNVVVPEVFCEANQVHLVFTEQHRRVIITGMTCQYNAAPKPRSHT